jgi:hypothetical protein
LYGCVVSCAWFVACFAEFDFFFATVEVAIVLGAVYSCVFAGVYEWASLAHGKQEAFTTFGVF